MAHKFRGPTKVQWARLARLEAIREAASEAVFAAAIPRMDVSFNDCRKLDPAASAAFDEAAAAVRAYERKLAADGRGYLSPHGYFTAY
jgi:hypothetical protein